jgi:tetratricopeptide (TPR) repeat protein
LLIRKDLLDNKAITTEVLGELTYLPLAIAQAAAYLNRNRILITQYLKLLRNTEQDIVNLMSEEFRDRTRYCGAKNAVATTWLVSFDQILKFDPTAADLLSFMSCIEPKAIPRSILPSVQPEERMVHAIGTLSGYAFVVRRGEEEVYDLHRLVHLATRVWVRKNSRATKAIDHAIRHVADTFPSNDYTNQELWRENLPHTLKLLEMTGTAESAERYDLCEKVGRCLDADGRIREAVRWLEKAFQWSQDKLGEEDLSRLDSQYALATAYEADGQVGKAVKLLEHVVAVEAKVLVKEHSERLALQHALAIAYQANEQTDKAVELLEHVVAVEATVLRDDHPLRLKSEQALNRVKGPR